MKKLFKAGAGMSIVYYGTFWGYIGYINYQSK